MIKLVRADEVSPEWMCREMSEGSGEGQPLRYQCTSRAKYGGYCGLHAIYRGVHPTIERDRLVKGRTLKRMLTLAGAAESDKLALKDLLEHDAW